MSASPHHLTLLLVDDRPSDAAYLRERLGDACELRHVRDTAGALRLIGRGGIDAVLLDWWLENDDSAGRFLESPMVRGSDLPVIVVSQDCRAEVIERAFQLGAVGFIHKGFSPEDLDIALTSALAHVRYRAGLRTPDAPGEPAMPLVLESARGRQLLRDIEAAARFADPVVLVGETGTGKTRAAEEIAARSRHPHPFIRFESSQMPETLLHPALFGIEADVATGVGKRMGVIDQAAGGTLLLDNVGELSQASQEALRQWLDGNGFRPVGGTVLRHTRPRLICASLEPLDELVRAGRMRADFRSRISVFSVVVPPLRERREDIPALAESMLTRIVATRGLRPLRFTAAGVEWLTAQPWPENIRQLENTILAAAIRCEIDTDGADIGPRELAAVMTAGITVPGRGDEELFALPYQQALKQHELDFVHRFMRHHLERHGHVWTRAATAAGTNRETFRLRAIELRRAGYPPFTDGSP